MASDWLVAMLPANQMPGLNLFDFNMHGNVFVIQTPGKYVKFGKRDTSFKYYIIGEVDDLFYLCMDPYVCKSYYSSFYFHVKPLFKTAKMVLKADCTAG